MSKSLFNVNEERLDMWLDAIQKMRQDIYMSLCRRINQKNNGAITLDLKFNGVTHAIYLVKSKPFTIDLYQE